MTPLLARRSIDAALRTACAGHPVALAYLFGSHAREAADADSDIDVAVLVQPHVSKLKRHELRLRLTRRLAEALSVDIGLLDVIILQDVPVLLQYNVIRSARPVLEKERGTASATRFEPSVS